MRHHFHRCSHLRVLTVEAAERSGNRKGGSEVLEELCEARGLTPCLGLAECDILTPAQKRALLVARATRLREEEGGTSALADVPDARAAELAELRAELLAEYERIVELNRQRAGEGAGALRRNPRPIPRDEESDLALAGISVIEDPSLRELRASRLDAIERALDAMDRPGFGTCVRCGGAIDVGRLRLAPDTRLCRTCVREAFPDVPPTSIPEEAVIVPE